MKRFIHILITIALGLVIIVSSVGLNIYHHICTKSGLHIVSLMQYECKHQHCGHEHHTVQDHRDHADISCCQWTATELTEGCCYDSIDHFRVDVVSLSPEEIMDLEESYEYDYTDILELLLSNTDFEEEYYDPPDIIDQNNYQIVYFRQASARGLDADSYIS